MENKPEIDEKMNAYVERQVREYKNERSKVILKTILIFILLAPASAYLAMWLAALVTFGVMKSTNDNYIFGAMTMYLSTPIICLAIFMAFVVCVVKCIVRVSKINDKIKDVKNEANDIPLTHDTTNEEPPKPITPYKPF